MIPDGGFSALIPHVNKKPPNGNPADQSINAANNLQTKEKNREKKNIKLIEILIIDIRIRCGRGYRLSSVQSPNSDISTSVLILAAPTITGKYDCPPFPSAPDLPSSNLTSYPFS